MSLLKMRFQISRIQHKNEHTATIVIIGILIWNWSVSREGPGVCRPW